MATNHQVSHEFCVGRIWREPNRREPWRVQCEDCVLGFMTEAQAREFVSRYLAAIAATQREREQQEHAAADMLASLKQVLTV